MKSKRAEIIKMYFEEKMRPVDIAKKLNITKSAITQVLKKDNRYLRIKKERKNINQRKHREKTKNYIRTKRKIAQFEKSADDLILKICTIKQAENYQNLNDYQIWRIGIGIKVLILIMLKREDLNLKKMN